MTDLDAKVFRRRGNTLIPSDTNADEWLATIGEGKEVTVTARKARNARQHKLLFALLRIVTDNSDQWPNAYALLDALKMATGHVDLIRGIGGQVIAKPASISYASMPQDRFSEWFKRALDIVARDILNTAPDDVAAEVYAMIGERMEKAA